MMHPLRRRGPLQHRRGGDDLAICLAPLFTGTASSRRRREVLGGNFPTSTMVQVVALARPELLLEINATAVTA